MGEACGIFAIALSIAHVGGQIFALSRRKGDRWSRSIPEITHAFCRVNGTDFDVKGARSIAQMIFDFQMTPGEYDLLGPYSADDFRRKFMGTSDRKPLYGGANEIKEAVEIIRANAATYGLLITPP